MTPPPVPTSAKASEADLRIGRQIRSLRLERELSLAELAEKTGISVGALSQIERGMTSLRVKVIWPLAAALDVEPSVLLSEPEEPVNDLYVVRHDHRRPIPVRSEGIAKELLSPPGAALTGMIVTVEPNGGTAESYAHKGHEFGLVLSGECELVIDSAKYRMREGDSFAFRSPLPHSFRNPGDKPCAIVWVNTIKPSEARDGD